jgi:hypothetical protein
MEKRAAFFSEKRAVEEYKRLFDELNSDSGKRGPTGIPKGQRPFGGV